MELMKGQTVYSVLGEPITVFQLLTHGGENDVYAVTYKGEQKALVWCKDEMRYEQVKKNAELRLSCAMFLLPEVITEKIGGEFGYIMSLHQKECHDLGAFMMNKVRFSSFKTVAEACLKIATAFQSLHEKGYCYQDWNSWNFQINPVNGDVLIHGGDSIGIIGERPKNFSVRYTAPEILYENAVADLQTDHYSLAVLLFILLFMEHPLEGKKSLNSVMTEEMQRSTYGKEAVFIYDIQDDSNRPVEGIHSNVINRWESMPDYVKSAFERAFSKDAIQNPKKRLSEAEWMEVFEKCIQEWDEKEEG